MFSLSGNVVDVLHRQIFPGTIDIEAGRIISITPTPHTKQVNAPYLLPGFVDSHIHLESSLLVPSEFARLASVHGTVATVSDPHEIANVLGLAGVRFMLHNAAQVPLTIAFGAPSCVPATPFETAGATLAVAEIRDLFEHDRISYLSEVMNVPGVLVRDPVVMQKIELAQRLGLPIDGHAPGLRGEEVDRYATAGITTDHECTTLDEAIDKLAAGMNIQIREGSAAKNFMALHPLIEDYPDRCMFCSDDKHPNDLVQGHINQLVQRSVALGHEVMNVLQIACVNPVLHYGLKVGLLQVGDPADFIVVNNLQDFNVERTYCKGVLVAEAGKALLPSIVVEPVNHFVTGTKPVEAFRLPIGGARVRVIEAIDGQLTTTETQIAVNQIAVNQIAVNQIAAPGQQELVTSDVEHDILKIALVNRYADVPPAIALIKNFHLKRGAIASSVAHDSHNIVAVGTTDIELCAAVNAVIQTRGGLAVVDGNQVEVLPLPVAGLMSAEEGYRVAQHYAQLDAAAKHLGSTLSAPFMTLSFMALLVIPDLKLSDRGLFGGQVFDFVPLWVNEK